MLVGTHFEVSKDLGHSHCVLSARSDVRSQLFLLHHKLHLSEIRVKLNTFFYTLLCNGYFVNRKVTKTSV